MDNPRQCHAAIFARPCGFPARRDRPYCINHDPEYREEHQAQSLRASAAAAAARRQHKPRLRDIALHLGNRAGIQAALDLIVRAELLGSISPARSRNIIRALHAAIRNIEPRNRRFPEEDMTDYLNYREDIEAFMPAAFAHARAAETLPPSHTPTAEKGAAVAPSPAAPPAPRLPGSGQHASPQRDSLKDIFEAAHHGLAADGLLDYAGPEHLDPLRDDFTPGDAEQLLARMRRR